MEEKIKNDFDDLATTLIQECDPSVWLGEYVHDKYDYWWCFTDEQEKYLTKKIMLLVADEIYNHINKEKN